MFFYEMYLMPKLHFVHVSEI